MTSTFLEDVQKLMEGNIIRISFYGGWHLRLNFILGSTLCLMPFAKWTMISSWLESTCYIYWWETHSERHKTIVRLEYLQWSRDATALSPLSHIVPSKLLGLPCMHHKWFPLVPLCSYVLEHFLPAPFHTKPGQTLNPLTHLFRSCYSICDWEQDWNVSERVNNEKYQWCLEGYYSNLPGTMCESELWMVCSVYSINLLDSRKDSMKLSR